MRTRLLHCGDLHIEEGRRFDVAAAALAFINDYVAREQIEIVLIGGDIFRTRIGEASRIRERNLFLQFIGRLDSFDHGAMPALIYGNHDAEGELEVYQPVGLINSPDRPQFKALATQFGVLGLVTLPYPTKRWALEALRGEGESIEELRLNVNRRLLDIIAGMRAQLTAPAIFLGHVSAMGARLGGGEMMTGKELELNPHDMDALKFAYCGLSHIHEPQQLGESVWYPGALKQDNHGDTERRGFTVVTLESGCEPRVEWIRNPTRPMRTIDAVWDGEALGMDPLALDDAVGAELRVRLVVNEEHLASVPDLRFPTAHSFKIEPEIIRSARAARRVAATLPVTLREHFQSWVDSQTPAPAPQTVADALEKIGGGDGES